ncbi:MAG TPA: permease-like cell division protein FtsX [Polyangiaceae bacterium]|nr:permease-like cell division protein FtsX [Polyangiaceae bacterium]
MKASLMSTASRAWRGGRADWKLHILSSFSSAVAFVCLASALLVVFNLDSVRERWARAGRASIYLREGTSEESVGELRKALEQTGGITSVRYVSQADARREVVGDRSDDTLAALPVEAFPASIEIEVAHGLSDTEVASITEKLGKIGAVESIETYQRYTDKLKSLLHAGVIASLILALVVLAAVVSVVASTVRLSLQRRKIEIEVLHLVGATESYVRGPFVVEGCVQGASGAAAAVVLLGLLYLLVREHAAEMLRVMIGVSPTFLPWYAVLSLVALGAALGAIASQFSLRRMVSA